MRKGRGTLAAALAAWAATLPGSLYGQAADPPEPFAILDNSFFIEEAFNQERGIFQNIFGFVRSEGGAWELAFTQEWPAGSQRHQVSYTVPFTGGDGASRIGHIFLHYRLQALTETRSRPAFTPRLSLILPTGDAPADLGDARLGAQANLPLSKQWGDLYWHGNAGITYHPHVRVDLWTPNLGASVIWRARPMVNLMLETVVLFQEVVLAPGVTDRETIWFLAPGLRSGWNLGDHQLVLGGAAAIGLTPAADDVSIFGYLSYELPFRR